MTNLARGKPGLVTTRQTKEGFAAFVVDHFCGHKVLGSYDRSYVFPLFDLSGIMEGTFLNTEEAERLARRRIAGPEDVRSVLDYTYAVFYSPSYRSRYAEYLKVDFPRVPQPRKRELYESLAGKGNELTHLHLLSSTGPDSMRPLYEGPVDPIVDRPSWSDEAVWLSPPQPLGRHIDGSLPRFSGIPEQVWQFQMGGYQVCEKWLKDRRGRALSLGEITHYQEIVVAIAETIRLMAEIDLVIEEHGGWPGAFAIPA